MGTAENDGAEADTQIQYLEESYCAWNEFEATLLSKDMAKVSEPKQVATKERERPQKELGGHKLEDTNRKAREGEAQIKLRQMGVCCEGYAWITQSGGYRCAGGSHFINDLDIGL